MLKPILTVIGRNTTQSDTPEAFYFYRKRKILGAPISSLPLNQEPINVVTCVALLMIMYFVIHSSCNIESMGLTDSLFYQVKLFHISSQQDAAKTDKISKRINELETISNNVKLLTEMMAIYNKNTTTQSEKDMMKVISLH